ncbi:MAG: hypothetical protein M1824_001923 [Vezdaea acicularis]|nr:MAG: hypothetical protein M1824_001923 [Vezdaea acicularis]
MSGPENGGSGASPFPISASPLSRTGTPLLYATSVIVPSNTVTTITGITPLPGNTIPFSLSITAVISPISPVTVTYSYATETITAYNSQSAPIVLSPSITTIAPGGSSPAIAGGNAVTPPVVPNDKTRLGPSAGSNTQQSSSSTPTAAASRGKHKSNAGAIAGGVVGGLVFLILLLFALIFFLKRRKRARQQRNNEILTEPKTYIGTGTSHGGSNDYAAGYGAGGKAYDPVPINSGTPGPETEREGAGHGTGAYDAPTGHDAYGTSGSAGVGGGAVTPPTSQHLEGARGRERVVNDDGVSIRSASPDLGDLDRHSFEHQEPEGGRAAGVSRLPLNDRRDAAGPAL